MEYVDLAQAGRQSQQHHLALVFRKPTHELGSLTRGACEAIAVHASDALKAIWLPRMTSGEWTGAMGLTESGAGSGLVLLKTRATLQGDGTYVVTGQKIVTSSSDHDFGGNMARLTDARAGVKGIMFFVPKFLPVNTGGFTRRDAMSVGALEKKRGIHAQPTCVTKYGGANCSSGS